MRTGQARKRWVIGGGEAGRGDRRLCWVALACVMAVVPPTQVLAASAGADAIHIQLRYKHQELTSPTGARFLLRRIGDAALEACGASTFSLAEFKTATQAGKCWRDAVDETVRRIGNPLLNAVASEVGDHE